MRVRMIGLSTTGMRGFKQEIELGRDRQAGEICINKCQFNMLKEIIMH